MRKRRVRQIEFLTGVSPEWFFHSWYTPKEHVFRDPNTFSNLHEAFSSVSRFVLIQRWTALIQRKPALSSSETALISAEIYKVSETALFGADLLWDFYPGTLAYCSQEQLNRLPRIVAIQERTKDLKTVQCCINRMSERHHPGLAETFLVMT